VRFACAGSIESENEGSDCEVRRLRLTWMIDWFSFLFPFFSVLVCKPGSFLISLEIADQGLIKPCFPIKNTLM
jgi:hypothetical protein